jgi:hypothetical protein
MMTLLTKGNITFALSCVFFYCCGLRHSFGTYYHSLRRDIPEVVYVMGNSVGIAKKHYVREVSVEQMEKFWALKPTE